MEREGQQSNRMWKILVILIPDQELASEHIWLLCEKYHRKCAEYLNKHATKDVTCGECLSSLLSEKWTSDLLRLTAFPLKDWHESDRKQGAWILLQGRAIDPAAGSSSDGVRTVMSLNQHCVSPDRGARKVYSCTIPFIWHSKTGKGIFAVRSQRIAIVLRKEFTGVNPVGLLGVSPASLVAYVAYSVLGTY